MKRSIYLLLCFLLCAGTASADGTFILVGWGDSLDGDGAKLQEDTSWDSGLGLESLAYDRDGFSLHAAFLPNRNGFVELTKALGPRWAFRLDLTQGRKWWDTSSGHEKTPAGYSTADYYPYADDLSVLTGRREAATTRRTADIQLILKIRPLEKIHFGLTYGTKDGEMTPLFRGFTFVGGVPLSPTVASERSYDEERRSIYITGNVALSGAILSFKTEAASLDNGYDTVTGAWGREALVGTTTFADRYDTDLFSAGADLSVPFSRGEVFGGLSARSVSSDASTHQTEAGLYLNGSRPGSGSIDLDTFGAHLGAALAFSPRWRLKVTASYRDDDKSGDYLETRTDLPGTWAGSGEREKRTMRYDLRLRWLPGPRATFGLYGRLVDRSLDDRFSTAISESDFDRSILEDVSADHEETRVGLRARLRPARKTTLRLKAEAFASRDDVTIHDLAWGYYPGERDTDGFRGSYDLSIRLGGGWRVSFTGNLLSFDRDIGAPFYDPIFDPSRTPEETSTDGSFDRHLVSLLGAIGKVSLQARVGLVDETFHWADAYSGSNYQPVEYDLNGTIYGLALSTGGERWSLSFDGDYIITDKAQDHDRVDVRLDYSHTLSNRFSLIARYRYVRFNENLYELDDYTGHLFGVGLKGSF